MQRIPEGANDVQLSIIKGPANTKERHEEMKLENSVRNSLIRKQFIQQNVGKTYTWSTKAEIQRLREAALNGPDSRSAANSAHAQQMRTYWEAIFKEGLRAEHQRHQQSLGHH